MGKGYSNGSVRGTRICGSVWIYRIEGAVGTNITGKDRAVAVDGRSSETRIGQLFAEHADFVCGFPVEADTVQVSFGLLGSGRERHPDGIACRGRPFPGIILATGCQGEDGKCH